MIRLKHKNIILLFAMYALLCVNGCSNSQMSDKNLVSTDKNLKMNEDVEIENNEITTTTIKNPYSNVDWDLTAMPQKLAYTVANRMNLVSEEYIGQIVKMNGKCSVFYDKKRDLYFYTCEINDETACCTLGIEFELSDDYKFPDDFPKDNEDVTVIGVFDTYKEGARTYKTLRKAILA